MLKKGTQNSKIEIMTFGIQNFMLKYKNFLENKNFIIYDNDKYQIIYFNNDMYYFYKNKLYKL